MKAPSWDHYRNWQFIVLHSSEEKADAFAYAKYIQDKFDIGRYENRKLNLAQKMYLYAMPRQCTMLVDCPYVIVPMFKCSKLNAEWVQQIEAPVYLMVRCREYNACGHQRGTGIFAAYSVK